MNFGQTLKAKRKALGLTTTLCAAKVSVSQPAWNQWELGLREPKFEKLREICRLLGVSSDELLGLSGGQYPVGDSPQLENKSVAPPDCKTCKYKKLADAFKAL